MVKKNDKHMFGAKRRFSIQNDAKAFSQSLTSQDKRKLFLVALTSILSGFCNAAIGAGGGILLTLALSALFSSAFSDRREILATTQAAMIPGCLLSSLIYSLSGSLDTSNFAIFAIPAIWGGIVGSLLLNRIRPDWINGIFSLLIIFSGFRMVT